MDEYLSAVNTNNSPKLKDEEQQARDIRYLESQTRLFGILYSKQLQCNII